MGHPVASAGDLVDFMACEHLASLEGRVKAGELERRPLTPDEQLVVRKGQDHERAYLAKLRAEGKDVVSVRGRPDAEGRRQAAAETIALLERGVEIVHNAHFVDLDEGWSGVADFLLRVPGPSRLGDWHYEVADTKLARSAKVSTIVQLCVYGELLERIQGVAPKWMYAILGDGSTNSFLCADYDAYYRRLKGRFLARDVEAPTYPEPVEYCARCHWNDACVERRRSDDHLSIVANVRRSQIVKLADVDITTAAALAAAVDDQRPRRLQRTTFDSIRAQAKLQVAARADGVARHEFLPFVAERGFAALPEPDPGDVYFDMEGDPFYDKGLEYLFGVSYRDDRGELVYRAFWGHDRAEERTAFEAFVDFIGERRARFPNMHVYHYAPYETTALKKLASSHGTREDEVDVLLRERVMIDLLAVVRQSLRASFESYSLKSIERFYLPARAGDVKDGLGSVVAYELYRDTHDAATLAHIEAYNRDDCDSTLLLHEWLVARRAEAMAHFATVELPWRERGAITKTPEPDEVRDGLVVELLAPIGDHDAESGEERARTLVAHLVPYHKREAKPEWWAYFARIEAPLEELVDESNAIGELKPTDSPPRVEKRSLVYEFTFPAQEHKLHAGSEVHDPATKASAGRILTLDDDAGILWLHRGPSLKEVALPPAIVSGGPIHDRVQRDALVRFGRAYATDGATTEYRALGALVRREPPRVRGRVAGGPLDDGHVDAESLTKLTLALDDSYVFVQGPPGTGKTWLGAQTIVALLAAGKRVGVTAKSHKAIHNLLAWVEHFAIERGQPFRGIKKSTGTEESVFASPHGLIGSSGDFALCSSDVGMQLVAGTAWLFPDPRLDAAFDVLVIDEAGQVSLADAIACGTAAHNLILLGDPMQLPHVSSATHPLGTDSSVLKHLLGEGDTVLPEMGLFLGTSFRMHESICSFVSALAYDGRLSADEACNQQRVDLPADSPIAAFAGAGLRYVPVAHDGNVQQSPEEADAVAGIVADLVRGTVTDCAGATRPLEQSDILIVTPYNAQVRRLRTTLRTRGFGDVRVGTVDKFQGQEAPVVLFSMASSRGDELPRGREFLFDRNRLNVAVSRARDLAILVCSPALLDTACKNPEQLAMVNALCRFVETAAPLAGI